MLYSRKNKRKPNQSQKHATPLGTRIFLGCFGSKTDQDEYAEEIRQRRRKAEDELTMNMPKDDVDQTEVISKVERIDVSGSLVPEIKSSVVSD